MMNKVIIVILFAFSLRFVTTFCGGKRKKVENTVQGDGGQYFPMDSFFAE